MSSKTWCRRLKDMRNLEHLDGGTSARGGGLFWGDVGRGGDTAPCPEQLLLQGELGDGERLRLLWGH